MKTLSSNPFWCALELQRSGVLVHSIDNAALHTRCIFLCWSWEDVLVWMCWWWSEVAGLNARKSPDDSWDTERPHQQVLECGAMRWHSSLHLSAKHLDLQPGYVCVLPGRQSKTSSASVSALVLLISSADGLHSAAMAAYPEKTYLIWLC